MHSPRVGERGGKPNGLRVAGKNVAEVAAGFRYNGDQQGTPVSHSTGGHRKGCWIEAKLSAPGYGADPWWKSREGM